MGELRDSFRPVEMDCPICGKHFIVYTPYWKWKTHTLIGKAQYVCSYTCSLKSEQFDIRKRKPRRFDGDKNLGGKDI